MRFPGHETVPIGNRVRVNAALEGMDTTRGTGESQGNVVCFKRFNEVWLEQLFTLSKVIFYKEYFE